jgi:AcrR family transcriptional regulator
MKKELSTVQYIAATQIRPMSRCAEPPLRLRNSCQPPRIRATDAPPACRATTTALITLLWRGGVTVVNAPTSAVEQRLLDQAVRLLAADGIAGLSLRRLAAAAGTSTMTVYSRFGSKQKLLAVLFREGFRRLGAELEGSSGPDPLNALAGLGRAYRRAALASPELYGLMFGPPARGLEPTAADAAAARATYVPLVDGVRAAITAGMLHGDADRVALHLWSVAHGMVSLEIAGLVDGAADGTDGVDAKYDEALSLASAPFLTDAVT